MLQISTLKRFTIGSLAMGSLIGCLSRLLHLIKPHIWLQVHVEVEPSIPSLVCNQVYYWQCTTLTFFNIKVILCSTSIHVGLVVGNNLLTKTQLLITHVRGVFFNLANKMTLLLPNSISFKLQSFLCSLKDFPCSQLSWRVTG